VLDSPTLRFVCEFLAPMYDHFTDRSRKVMRLARREATRYGAQCIDTEHLLLGLIKEGSGVAANVLKSTGVDPRDLQQRVGNLTHPRSGGPTAGLELAEQLQFVLKFAKDEAAAVGHSYIGTEHLLIGLCRLSDGGAATILEELGLRRDLLRREVLELLGHRDPSRSDDAD
jgi:ATP-dependent Clp protease ATP-binding subunit ClpC